MNMATQQARQTTTVTQDRLPAGPGVLDQTIEATLKRLDESADRYAAQLAQPMAGRIERMVLTSRALRDIRGQLTDKLMTEFVMPLMNSSLGFLCDLPSKNDQRYYSIPEVRECVIQALLLDFRLTGNEFNIIAGRFYGAQAGYYRKLCDLPNVTNVRVIGGTPVLREGRTIVRMGISCNVDGKPWELRDAKGQTGREFVVRVNSGMGDDGVIGKAKRKALKAAFEELSGINVDDMDDASAGEVMPESSVESAKAKLGAFVAQAQANGNGHTETAAESDISSEPAPEELYDEIDRECIRASTQPAQVQELVKAAGAKKLRALTIGQAERILAELRAMPGRDE
jgi:hypothetical protein